MVQPGNAKSGKQPHVYHKQEQVMGWRRVIWLGLGLGKNSMRLLHLTKLLLQPAPNRPIKPHTANTRLTSPI